MSNHPLRILIAMSGGVDSSVAAALLKEKGHDVIGVMMRLWSDPNTENLCCTPDSMSLAREIAEQLSIPFHTIDAVAPFREQVVQYFIDSYTSGETPNPCVACNRYLRWDILWTKALELDATHIATGHYARLLEDASGKVLLLRGVDPLKDQSYVLHGLSQKKLAHTIFPLGSFTKAEIRAIARRLSLPVAERSDSQDLCFVGNEGYRDFLVRYAPEAVYPGPITTIDGKVVGQHQGLAFYTIGQRKGLRISADWPYYVCKKDIDTNTLVVGRTEDLSKQELSAKNVNWISGDPPKVSIRADVQVRYKARGVPAIITPHDDEHIHVKFEQPVRDITPGQAVVLYASDVCLGGGTILPG